MDARLRLGPYLLLLFPNGRLPGRRWRPAAWAGGAAMAALIAACAVLAWPMRGTTLYQSMLDRQPLSPLDTLEGLLYLVGDALIVVAAVALLVRLRRLRGAERQQTKWSSATSCTTSTGCSTGRWCTRWSPRSWGPATPPW